MRILYIPFFSNQSNHNGCSIYNTMKVFFRGLVDNHENMFVYFLVPSNIPYQEDEVLQHPRIKVMEIPALGRDQYDEKVLVPSEILYENFNEDIGKYYYDVLISDKAHTTNYLKNLLGRKFLMKESTSVKYVTLTQFVIKKTGRFAKMMDDYEFGQCLGWLSGYNMFENERNADVCYSIAKKYLTPVYVQKIMDSSYYGNVYGLNTKVLDNYYIGNTYKKGEKLRINFANRVAIHYKFEEVLDVVDFIFRSGVNATFVITTPNKNFGTYASKRVEKMKKLGMDLEIHLGLRQKEFYDIAKSCHLFISYIDELQSPNAYMEQFYLGQIGILPQAEWVDYFFPDYPFKFDSFSSAFSLVQRFVNRPEEMIAYNLKLREDIKKRFDINHNAKNFGDWLNKLMKDSFYPCVSDVQIDMVRAILKEAGNPQRFTVKEYKQMFKDYPQRAVIKFDIPTFRRINKFDFIQCLFHLGYKDTLEPELAFEYDNSKS